MRRSQPVNSSLLFSPHAPKSTLQQFAAVLPSCAEVHPSTVRYCSPLTRRSQPSDTSLLFSPHAPKSTLQQFAVVLPPRAEVRLPPAGGVLPKRTELHPPTLRLFSPRTRRCKPSNTSIPYPP